MAIETMTSHILAARAFKNNLVNLWCGFAKPTPWENEEVPPVENQYETTLDTPIGYKRFETSSLIVPATADTPVESVDFVSYDNQSWVFVPDSQAFDRNARYVYLSVFVYAGEMPYVTVRQIGIFQDLKPLPSFGSSQCLLASQVSDPGHLMGYENRRSTRFDEDVKIREEIILKF